MHAITQAYRSTVSVEEVELLAQVPAACGACMLEQFWALQLEGFCTLQQVATEQRASYRLPRILQRLWLKS